MAVRSVTMREEEIYMVIDFMNQPIAAAIRTERDFSTALRSERTGMD